MNFPFAKPFAGGAQDKSALLSAERLGDLLQPLAFLFALDAARDADVLGARHENHVAARQGDMRGNPRAFGAERILGNLDENFFTTRKLFFQRQTAR